MDILLSFDKVMSEKLWLKSLFWYLRLSTSFFAVAYDSLWKRLPIWNYLEESKNYNAKNHSNLDGSKLSESNHYGKHVGIQGCFGRLVRYSEIT